MVLASLPSTPSCATPSSCSVRLRPTPVGRNRRRALPQEGGPSRQAACQSRARSHTAPCWTPLKPKCQSAGPQVCNHCNNSNHESLLLSPAGGLHAPQNKQLRGVTALPLITALTAPPLLPRLRMYQSMGAKMPKMYPITAARSRGFVRSAGQS